MENNKVRKSRQNRSGSYYMDGLMARVTKEGISVESYVNHNKLLSILECVTNHIFTTIAKRADIPQGEITVKMLQAFSNGITDAVEEFKEIRSQSKDDVDSPPVVVISTPKELEKLFDKLDELMGMGESNK